MAYPRTAADNKKVALDLVQHLRNNIQNTQDRDGWSQRNFRVLRQFAEESGCDAFYRGADGPNRREFVWDFFAGYGTPAHKAALFVAESEFNIGDLHDWEKLFYANAPVNIMMFRVTSPENAEVERNRYASYMACNYTLMPAGTVFVLYGVYWSETRDSPNRDTAYIFQVPGEPNLQAVIDPQFTQINA